MEIIVGNIWWFSEEKNSVNIEKKDENIYANDEQ